MQIPVNPQDLLFLLAPALIAVLRRPAWSATAAFLLAVGVCGLAALAEVLLTGQTDATRIGVILGKAFVLTMTAYSGVWKPFLPKELSFLENQVNAGAKE